MTDTPTVAELRPRNDMEEAEAARAVYEQRKRDADDRLIDGLTDREKLLIEYAWKAGADAVRNKLSKELVHPHASTLDADSVRRAVTLWADNPEVFREPHRWDEGWAPPYDSRVVNLVARASRFLERNAPPAT